MLICTGKHDEAQHVALRTYENTTLGRLIGTMGSASLHEAVWLPIMPPVKAKHLFTVLCLLQGGHRIVRVRNRAAQTHPCP